jgi:hypothetical protein
VKPWYNTRVSLLIQTRAVDDMARTDEETAAAASEAVATARRTIMAGRALTAQGATDRRSTGSGHFLACRANYEKQLWNYGGVDWTRVEHTLLVAGGVSGMDLIAEQLTSCRAKCGDSLRISSAAGNPRVWDVELSQFDDGSEAGKAVRRANG